MRKIMKSLIWAVVTISTITYMSPVYAIANKETIKRWGRCKTRRNRKRVTIRI